MVEEFNKQDDLIRAWKEAASVRIETEFWPRGSSVNLDKFWI